MHFPHNFITTFSQSVCQDAGKVSMYWLHNEEVYYLLWAREGSGGNAQKSRFSWCFR